MVNNPRLNSILIGCCFKSWYTWKF